MAMILAICPSALFPAALRRLLRGLLELGVEEGGGLLAGCYLVLDVHRDMGQCGDRRRLCGHGFTLFGLDRLLTGALGVELEAEAAHHLCIWLRRSADSPSTACSNCCLALVASGDGEGAGAGEENVDLPCVLCLVGAGEAVE
jgi:hypothetical protein